MTSTTSRLAVPGAVLAMLLGVSRPALGQWQRPLETHDPATIGAGRVLVEVGVVALHDLTFPVSGLRGYHLNVPSLGISLGVGPRAEVRIDHASLQGLLVMSRMPGRGPRQPTFRGRTTWDVDDLVVGAKTGLLAEGRRRPAIGLHFATRLPNAGTESGLGLDTMDFHMSLLAGKSIGPMRLAANVGVAILGDPTSVARQNDVLRYGLSVTAPLSGAVVLLAEVNGRANTRPRAVPPGTDSSAYVRAGLRFGRGTVRVDGAVVVGLHPDDASVGMTVGLSWRVPGFGAS